MHLEILNYCNRRKNSTKAEGDNYESLSQDDN